MLNDLKPYRFASETYGIFFWTEANRYPAKNAVKIFKSKVLAQKFADKNIDKNYVVRTIFNPNKESSIRTAARPIHIDRQHVDACFNRLIAAIEKLEDGVPLGSFFMKDKVPVRTVSGNIIDVQVQFRFKVSSSRAMVLGGGSGKTVVSKVPAVLVNINGRYPKEVFTESTSGDSFKTEIYSILMHELSHQADVYKKPMFKQNRTTIPQEWEVDAFKYYNNPSEVKAYMRSVFEEIRDNLDDFVRIFGVNNAIRRLLPLSNTWIEIKDNLTDSNERLILNGLYRAVMDHIKEVESNMDRNRTSYELIKVAKTLLSEDVGIFDPDDHSAINGVADSLMKTIPFASVSLSVLGGKNRASIMVVLSLQPKSEWQNGILENSDYAKMSINRDGTIVHFSGYGIPKMRKTRVHSLTEAIEKIRKHVSAYVV